MAHLHRAGAHRSADVGMPSLQYQSVNPASQCRISECELTQTDDRTERQQDHNHHAQNDHQRQHKLPPRREWHTPDHQPAGDHGEGGREQIQRAKTEARSLVTLVILLLPRLNSHFHAILSRRNGTRPFVVVRAIRIVRIVEVDQEFAVPDRLDVQIAACAIRFFGRSRIDEGQEEVVAFGVLIDLQRGDSPLTSNENCPYFTYSRALPVLVIIVTIS